MSMASPPFAVLASFLADLQSASVFSFRVRSIDYGAAMWICSLSSQVLAGCLSASFFFVFTDRAIPKEREAVLAE